jgi:hypothetical protein
LQFAFGFFVFGPFSDFYQTSGDEFGPIGAEEFVHHIQRDDSKMRRLGLMAPDNGKLSARFTDRANTSSASAA